MWDKKIVDSWRWLWQSGFDAGCKHTMIERNHCEDCGKQIVPGEQEY